MTDKATNNETRATEWIIRFERINTCCPIPDVCTDERRLPSFIARATMRERIAGLEARATGGAAR